MGSTQTVEQWSKSLLLHSFLRGHGSMQIQSTRVFGKGLTMFVNICCEKYCCRTGYLGHNFEQSDLCKNAVIVTSALLEYGQKPFKMNHCGVNEQDTAKVGEGLSMKGSR